MSAGMSTPTPPARLLKRALPLVTLLGALFLGACDRVDAESLPEWSAADHTNQGQPSKNQVDTKKARPGMPDLEKEGITDVVLATWKQNCIACHGTIGRGDGPQARTFRPPDFTNPVWQKNAMAPEMTNTIKKGKGKMPPFAHLPDETVAGLIQLIRRLNSDRSAAAAPKAPPAAAPTTEASAKADAPKEGTPSPTAPAAPPPAAPAKSPAAP